MNLTPEQQSYLNSLPAGERQDYLKLQADLDRCRQEWREQFRMMGTISRGVDVLKDATAK